MPELETVLNCSNTPSVINKRNSQDLDSEVQNKYCICESDDNYLSSFDSESISILSEFLSESYSFLAPTGAQEVALSVRVSVRVSVTFMNSSLNLHSILEQS